ncbi:MAG: glycosyltransferase [Nanoarchaeota archaeon]
MLNEKILFAAWSCNNPNYFAYQTWNSPLKKLFKKVISFDPQENTYKFGKDRMNKDFLKIIAKEKPEYLFLWLIYDEFYPKTLFSIKKISPKTKVINFCGDDDAQFYDYSSLNSFFVDYSLITHKEFIKNYKNKAFFSVGTNTDQFKPLGLEKKYDVTFIGTPKTDRAEFVSYLMNKGVKIRVFGAGWGQYPEFKKIYGGFLDKEDYTKVINQSRINLCFNKNYLGTTHVIQKFFEINACKSFMLTEYCKGYSDLFISGKELVMFKDSKELYEKVIYYLKNENEMEKIAESAYEKIIADYSSKVELDNIFTQIRNYGDKIPKKKLPEIKEKIHYLSVTELSKNQNELKKILKDVDYISFKTGSQSLPYRNLFQITAMKMFNKEISCCDSYLYSRGLGDYLVLYSNLAFKTLKPDEFAKSISLDQLVVKKKFFIFNFKSFLEFSKGKPIDIITQKNTAFVTRPFVRLNSSPAIDYQTVKKILWPKYEENLRSWLYRRNPVALWYILSIFFSRFSRNKIIFNHLSETISTRMKKSRIISSLKKIF